MLNNENTIYSQTKKMAGSNKTHERIMIGSFVANTFLKLLPELSSGLMFHLATSDLNKTPGAIKFVHNPVKTNCPEKDFEKIGLYQNEKGEWVVPSWFGNCIDLYSALERNVLGKILLGEPVSNFGYVKEVAPPFFLESTQYIQHFGEYLDANFFLPENEVMRHFVLNKTGEYIYNRLKETNPTILGDMERSEFIENFRNTALSELIREETRNLYKQYRALVYRVFYKVLSWDYSLDHYLSIANSYLENAREAGVDLNPDAMVVQMLFGLSAMDTENLEPSEQQETE